ncbi:hypothetical protein JAAARDRAFT_211375 [Jaapia argillacea MUCL 33604]|uniref:Small ribosomal subunit protein mS29 n=1 Tax=Jaapia argillacea MUCL 33604 TaxID=933084 RepID=A0A067PB81_9AGAM|nr:hypothetical protein JAAARDRAFT_211375 [Jaapia argillacea MUCL 33604]
MSPLTTLTLAGSRAPYVVLSKSSSFLSTNTSTLPVTLTQRRHYAAPARGKGDVVARQGFKGKGKGQGPDGVPVKREKKLGAFLPLPAASLHHSLFKTDPLNELKLPLYRPEHLTTHSIGTAMQFVMSKNDAALKFGLPKSMLLEFRILSKPCSVVRDVTVKAVDKLDEASQKSSFETRVVFTGSPGCGKSFALLQSVEYCASRDWIVLYVPRGINLVNSTSSYTYDLRTQTYLQPAFSFQTLQRFLSVNQDKLQSLKTITEVPLERRAPIPVGTPLTDLIAAGLREQSVAPTVLSALLEQLGKQEAYPVLLAIDDFQALYCQSRYRDPHYAHIKSYHLSVPRLLLDYASGSKTFARGAVFGALSTCSTDFQLPLELREALAIPHDRSSGPYVKRSSILQWYSRGLQALPVPDQMSVQEAAALFEIWMKDGAFVGLPNDDAFMSKYAESSGNARQFVWKGLLASLAS